MNRYSILLFYLLFVSLAIHSQGFNSLAQKGLKGMVKSIKSVCYNTAEYSDNIYKTSVITTEQQNRDIPLYPTYVCEYNEDGNIVEKTIYDELGVCLCVYAYKCSVCIHCKMEAFKCCNNLCSRFFVYGKRIYISIPW